MKIIILVLFLFIFFGCIKVEQEVEHDSRIDCTYIVKTLLWLNSGFLWSNVHLEKAFRAYNVKKSDIEIIKAKQMAAMLPYKQKLEEAIKTECN